MLKKPSLLVAPGVPPGLAKRHPTTPIASLATTVATNALAAWFSA